MTNNQEHTKNLIHDISKMYKTKSEFERRNEAVYTAAKNRGMLSTLYPNKRGRKSLTTAEAIDDFKYKHGDKYNYDKVDYQGARVKVTITCPKHGDFAQSPSAHKAGHGCEACTATGKRTLEQTIEDFRAVHGDLYDYSHVKYVNSHTHVIILCKKHGGFFQTPNNHKKHGIGLCPKCVKDK